jgi:hypothetical protein
MVLPYRSALVVVMKYPLFLGARCAVLRYVNFTIKITNSVRSLPNIMSSLLK